eukprot:Gb_27333 [translate_table: standard]
MEGKTPEWYTSTYERLDSKINHTYSKLDNKINAMDGKIKDIKGKEENIMDQLSQFLKQLHTRPESSGRSSSNRTLLLQEQEIEDLSLEEKHDYEDNHTLTKKIFLERAQLEKNDQPLHKKKLQWFKDMYGNFEQCERTGGNEPHAHTGLEIHIHLRRKEKTKFEQCEKFKEQLPQRHLKHIEYKKKRQLIQDGQKQYDAVFTIHTTIVDKKGTRASNHQCPVIACFLIPNNQIGCFLGKSGCITEKMRSLRFGVVPTSVAFLSPETVEGISLSNGQLAILTSMFTEIKISLNYGSHSGRKKSRPYIGEKANITTTDDSKGIARQVICQLVFLETVSRGHVMLAQSLCLHIGANIHNKVLVKVYAWPINKQPPALLLSPVCFILSKKGKSHKECVSDNRDDN